MSATRTITRDMLEDRWAAFYEEPDGDTDDLTLTDPYVALSNAVEAAYVALARRSAHEMLPFPDGRFAVSKGSQGDVGGYVAEEAIQLVRNHLISTIDELGIAR